MSTEIVAVPRGELVVQPGRALRLAWGLASAEHCWLGDPWDLPTLPDGLSHLSQIPAAQQALSLDGRWDLQQPDAETGERFPTDRDHWRPEITVSHSSLTWRPLELDRSGHVRGRQPGGREIEIWERPGGDRWLVRWDTGGVAARFVGRCLLAALGSVGVWQSLSPRWRDQLVLRECARDTLWWALPEGVTL